MKTLTKRNNSIVKWILIVVICYLLASVGVNQVVNPFYYFHEEQTVELPLQTDEDAVSIDVSAYEEGFLTIKVEDMNTFSVSVKARITYKNGEKEEKTIEIGNVINCYKIQKLGEGIIQITIPQAALKDAGIQISDIEWSPKRQVNTLQMILVFISFFCLVAFYNFMQFIKKKYTK